MSETHSLAPGLTVEDVQIVSPALAHYTQEAVMDGVWKRPQFSLRDRGLITVAALIARSQTLAMPYYFEKALDSGVKAASCQRSSCTSPSFYSGFPNAMAAINPAKDVFQKRGISPGELPPVKDELLPLNEEAESQRATQVANNFGAVSPGLVEHHQSAVPRSMAPSGPRTARPEPYHCRRFDRFRPGTADYLPSQSALDNGLTEEQASEIPTHLAFYTGWPNCFSCVS